MRYIICLRFYIIFNIIKAYKILKKSKYLIIKL